MMSLFVLEDFASFVTTCWVLLLGFPNYCEDLENCELDSIFFKRIAFFGF